MAAGAQKLWAHVLPMAVFLAFLALVSALKKLGGAPWLTHPEYWIYPLQTVVCAALLWYFQRNYERHRFARPLFTIALALFVFVLWIAPQAFLQRSPRTDGFNPDFFAAQPVFFWTTIAFRFLRLVIVVPLLEEIFWRGFLLRYLIEEAFWKVRFGTFTWFSCAAVVIGFTLGHSMADWPAAFVTGILYNLVAYRTRSLTSCIIAHALTNLALGLWIMQTKQWGFW